MGLSNALYSRGSRHDADMQVHSNNRLKRTKEVARWLFRNADQLDGTYQKYHHIDVDSTMSWSSVPDKTVLPCLASQSSESSVSSVSETAPYAVKGDGEQAPKRTCMIIDVDEIPKTRRSTVIDVDEIPRSIQVIKDKYSMPPLPEKLQTEIKSRHVQRKARILEGEIQVVSDCRSILNELQKEIFSHTWKVQLCCPTRILPHAIQIEIGKQVPRTHETHPVLVADLASIVNHVKIAKTLPEGLKTEIVDHVKRKPVKKLPGPLLREIVTYRRPMPQVALARSKAKHAKKRKPIDKVSTDLNVKHLAKRCDDLTKLTEVLSMKLLQDSQTNHQKTQTAVQLVRKYQRDIIQIERQHQAQLKELNGNMRQLESELRRHKIESVPPIVPSRVPTKKVTRDQKRIKIVSPTGNATMKSVVEACLNPYTTSKSEQTASLSRISNVILQNKFFPALLLAIASVRNQEY